MGFVCLLFFKHFAYFNGTEYGENMLPFEGNTQFLYHTSIVWVRKSMSSAIDVQNVSENFSAEIVSSLTSEKHA